MLKVSMPKQVKYYTQYTNICCAFMTKNIVKIIL